MADGVFYAELNEFFQRELAEEGYSGVEVRVTPTVTDISKGKLLHDYNQGEYMLISYTQSSVLLTPKKSSANRADAFENSHP